jgi:hypothetical protein
MTRTFIFLIAVSVQSICLASTADIPLSHRKALQDISRFDQISATDRLPVPVLALCLDVNGRLAEPDNKWEPTDVIIDSTLPRHRLIWAVAGGGYYVVHYESGGRGHSYHILVAKQAEGEPQLVWHGTDGRFENFEIFLDTLRRSNRP